MRLRIPGSERCDEETNVEYPLRSERPGHHQKLTCPSVSVDIGSLSEVAKHQPFGDFLYQLEWRDIQFQPRMAEHDHEHRDGREYIEGADAKNATSIKS